jgi:cell division protein FtsB
MRLLFIALVALLALIQYPLWLGKGGWLRVWELDRQVLAQQGANSRLAERNASLDGEVRDLRQGLLAVEERARYELGMVRPDEIFIQYNESGARRRASPDASENAGQTSTAAAPAPSIAAAAAPSPPARR